VFELDVLTCLVEVADHDGQEEVPHDDLADDDHHDELDEELVGHTAGGGLHDGVPIVTREHLEGGDDGDEEGVLVFVGLVDRGVVDDGVGQLLGEVDHPVRQQVLGA